MSNLSHKPHHSERTYILFDAAWRKAQNNAALLFDYEQDAVQSQAWADAQAVADVYYSLRLKAWGTMQLYREVIDSMSRAGINQAH